MENTHAYFYFLIFFVAAVVLALAGLKVAAATGRYLYRSKVEKTQNDGYAGGFYLLSALTGRFPVRFVFTALLFVLFNAEFLLLLPWAMSLRLSGGQGAATAFAVLAIWGVGYYYEYKKGALEWK